MRAQISEKVIQLFVEIVGFIDHSQVSEQTDFIHDFKIIDDDLTCFVMQIKWWLNYRYRRQAISHSWNAFNCGSPACPRWRQLPHSGLERCSIRSTTCLIVVM